MFKGEIYVPSRENSRKMENIDIIHISVPVSACQHARVVVMDTVVTFFTGLHPPSSFILPGFHFVHHGNIAQGCILELTLRFQWFSSIFLQVLSNENTSCFCYHSCCCPFLLDLYVHVYISRLWLEKATPNLLRYRHLSIILWRSLEGFVVAFIPGEC